MTTEKLDLGQINGALGASYDDVDLFGLDEYGRVGENQINPACVGLGGPGHHGGHRRRQAHELGQVVRARGLRAWAQAGGGLMFWERGRAAASPAWSARAGREPRAPLHRGLQVATRAMAKVAGQAANTTQQGTEVMQIPAFRPWPAAWAWSRPR